MCGIAGFTGNGSRSDGEAMIRAIRYRGPDNQDVFSDGRICLGHARLSIIDLSADGNQPMFSSDRRLAITYNGEIYNYLELRKQLEHKYSFRTHTDTEVLLYLYRELNTGMLDKINGMFAFALYDFDSEELFVARDRMGKKPLYYTEQDGCFVFASELKALLAHPSVPKKLNLEAVNQYLTFDYVPAPSSIIAGVSKLEPGHFLKVHQNKVTTHKVYWDVAFEERERISLNNAMRELDALLDEATRIRLMSDVPLGVFLSGGLDSSTIAYYAQKNSSQKVKTFSIGFEDKSYDEAGYAEQVAKHLGTEHRVRTLTARHTLELIDEIYPLSDEPFADASLIPTYFLSQFTREHVTVALGGDGSDELLAGYPTFISDHFKFPLAWMPAAVTRSLIKIADQLLPASDKNISLDFKIKQYLRGFLGERNHIHQLWLGSFTPGEKAKLFLPEVYGQLNDRSGLGIADHYFATARDTWPEFGKTTYYYCKTYLPDDILVKVDRASMYNSLEVRAPFLDRKVVEFVNALPKSFKQRGFESKFVLKRLMEQKLPKNIVYRNKKGFGIPLSDWIRKDLRSTIDDLLLQEDPYFSRSYIRTLIDDHHSGRHNHRKLLWNLFILKKYLLQHRII